LDATPSVLVGLSGCNALYPYHNRPEGMIAEPVLGCAILKHCHHLTCEEFAFCLEDSDLLRNPSCLEMGPYGNTSIFRGENINQAKVSQPAFQTGQWLLWCNNQHTD
jgi:hypothetical protein